MTVPPLRELVHTMLLTEQEADLIDDLRANKVVVVACPPGSRVVVSRESKPCEACGGDDPANYINDPPHTLCPACGGFGVVEATTIHGLESLGRVRVETPIEGTAHKAISSVEGFKLVDLGAVALPEETPQ